MPTGVYTIFGGDLAIVNDLVSHANQFLVVVSNPLNLVMTTTEISWQTPFSDERRPSVASFYPSPTSNPMSEKDGYESRRASGISVTADTGREQRERAKEKEAQVEDEDAGQTVKLTDFDVVSTLGTGTFGRVLLVRLRPAANQPGAVQHFAMKVLKKNEVVRLKQVEHVNSERNILSRIRHPFIVDL
ncbi:unnamed protein product [Rhizoctonia solani]|uniref:cAMP-dependent protein kinase n=1 Tax=Rhizoctonia solani TaxID=456999 RepID=A0A8H2X407_9AGAM|nr:unnamed protein product [Rhizoctonia solani]